jgi:hypothetical protein
MYVIRYGRPKAKKQIISMESIIIVAFHADLLLKRSEMAGTTQEIPTRNIANPHGD